MRSLNGYNMRTERNTDKNLHSPQIYWHICERSGQKPKAIFDKNLQIRWRRAGSTGVEQTLPSMLGKGPNKERREMKGKSTCHLPLEWKTKVPAEREWANDRIVPGEVKTRGERKGGGGRQGKNHRGQRLHNILFTERVLNRNIARLRTKRFPRPLDVSGDGADEGRKGTPGRVFSVTISIPLVINLRSVTH